MGRDDAGHYAESGASRWDAYLEAEWERNWNAAESEAEEAIERGATIEWPPAVEAITTGGDA
jgi:hypothetical protein